MKKIEDMSLREAQAALKRVQVVARRVKEEEGWCDSGFQDAMDEIGIETEPVKTDVLLRIRVLSDRPLDKDVVADAVANAMDDDPRIYQFDTPDDGIYVTEVSRTVVK